MLEKEIEKYLVDKVKKMNGLCIKMNSISFSGLPDRLVILPQGIIFFIELKAPNKKPRPLQQAVIEKLRSSGVEVYVADSKKYIGEILEGEVKRNGDRVQTT